jgi:hypothetical protein
MGLWGPIPANAAAGDPPGAWSLDSLVHLAMAPRRPRVRSGARCLNRPECFPAGVVAAACYFPAVARKVLWRIADALPGRADGN